MDSEIVFSLMITILLFENCLVLSQMDYYPPVIDETLKTVDSREVKCLGKLFIKYCNM